jgi:hypothetical protein
MTAMTLPITGTYGDWIKLADMRAEVALDDNTTGVLVGVRYGAHKAKVRIGSRHYFIPVERILLVRPPVTIDRDVLDDARSIRDRWPGDQRGPTWAPVEPWVPEPGQYRRYRPR